MNHAPLWKQYFPAFVGSDDRFLGQLMAAASLVRIAPRQQVFYLGKACDHYLLILSGSVKAQIISPDGKELVLYHVHSGDSCVLTTSCLLGNSNYPAEGITETEVTAFAIPAHVFHRVLGQSPLFREFVFHNFSTRLADVIRRMESLSFDSVDQKLAKVLIAIGDRVIHTTHNELSLEMGTAREVVSRHLKRFESQGWLTLTRGAIQDIDYPALKRLAAVHANQ